MLSGSTAEEGPLNRMRTLVLASLAVALLAVPPAGAVIGGTPDGDAHPYVGYVISFETGQLCSGSLISDRLFVTAAHCLAGTGETVVVSTHPQAIFGHESWVPGVANVHPDACMGCGPGLPNTAQSDVAVIELFAPIASPRYAQLPTVGLSDRLEPRASLTVVGYGVQGFTPGPGGRTPHTDLTRTRATVTLNPGNFAWRHSFLRISANRSGICFGDSGGPNLVGDTIVAINSYANSYRLDTLSALSFIARFQ
jgi:hypothetical protein